MREIFSVRFFAAAAAVVGLFVVLSVIFAAGEAIDDDGLVVVDEPAVHGIDFVDQVFTSTNPDFGFDAEGLVTADTELIIDRSRSLRVVAGTPGVDLCPDRGEIGACAVVADLLGEAVVWFALVPMGDNRTVPLPAIDVLDDGRAELVNGWRLRYAPVLDRRCADGEVEWASYREFREALGDDFTSLYSLETGRIEAVVCHQRVPWVPGTDEVLPAWLD